MAYSTLTRNIKEAARIIHEGRVVAFPTGTSYGLAADALQGFALQRLRNLKCRPDTKTFTVFMSDKLIPIHLTLTDREQVIIEHLAGQPLTLLVKPKRSLGHLSQNGRLGLRIIDHPLMQELANAVDVPLTATSANIALQPPCFDPDCIQQAFRGILDATRLTDDELKHVGPTTYDLSLGCIIDSGTLPNKPATTIASIVDGTVKIIRKGPLTKEAILA